MRCKLVAVLTILVVFSSCQTTPYSVNHRTWITSYGTVTVEESFFDDDKYNIIITYPSTVGPRDAYASNYLVVITDDNGDEIYRRRGPNREPHFHRFNDRTKLWRGIHIIDLDEDAEFPLTLQIIREGTQIITIRKR